MADDLMTKIQDAVRAALPAHLSDELQKVLKEASDNKDKLKYCSDQNKSLNIALSEKMDTISKFGELIKREIDCLKREEAITKREIKMELNEYKVQAAEQRIKDHHDVVMAVFQNNTFKYNRTASTSQNGYSPTGSTNSNGCSTDKIETEG